ncbi:MAG: GNAT family N-acetyltransferase [Candidatus Micrarchaeaceae archaeon]|jgi:N-acetylglutamate synthase-like GNAT family acetyltransferase
MEIKRSNSNNEERLAKFLVNYWKTRDMNLSLKWAKDYLKKGMTSEMKEERFVFIDNGKILGTIALLKYYENVAEIRDEIWKNNEIGFKLLSHIIKVAKKEKFRKLYSLALKDKVGFYKKQGFVKEGLLKNHFKFGEDITIMSKFL